MTTKPSPAWDEKKASELKPRTESEESYSGKRCDDIVYQDGTCTVILPCWGKIDFGLNSKVRTELVTANSEEELVRVTSFSRITDYWNAATVVIPSTMGTLFKSQPA